MQLSSLKNQILVLLKNKTALNCNAGANTFQNIRFKLFFSFWHCRCSSSCNSVWKAWAAYSAVLPPLSDGIFAYTIFPALWIILIETEYCLCRGGRSHHHHFSQKCIRCVPIYFVQGSSVTFQLNFDWIIQQSDFLAWIEIALFELIG